MGGEVSIFGFEILPQPSERLCTQKPGMEHCTLTGLSVSYQSRGSQNGNSCYKEMFFRSHGKIPNWGLPLAKWSAETLKI
jgi:hypothetical protein